MRTGKSLFGCMIQRRDRDSGDIFRGQQWDAFEEKSRVLRREEQNTRGSDHEMVFIRRGGRLIGANIGHRHLQMRVGRHHLAHFHSLERKTFCGDFRLKRCDLFS